MKQFALWAVCLSYCAIALPTAGSSPLQLASSPYAAQRWLWEPLTQLDAPSHGVTREERGQQGQLLTMKPGATALLRLPPGYWLRLLSVDSAASEGSAPALWFARGNGLYLPTKAHPGSEPGEWLLPPPAAGEVNVMLENSAAVDARWWLSRARPQVATERFPYRRPVADQADNSHWYFRSDSGKHIELSELKSGEQFAIELQGPGEWRMEARQLLTTQRPWQRFIDVPVALNGEHWRDWRLYPSFTHRQTLRGEGCTQLSSVAEELYLSLPAGRHRVSLIAPQAMSLRVLALEQPDFAFARNRPVPSAEELVDAYRLHSAPSAQPPYDESFLLALLRGDADRRELTPDGDQVDPGLAPVYKAARLLEARYRFWRPLPIASNAQTPLRARLVEVAAGKPGVSGKRYIPPPVGRPETRSLQPLAPGQSLTLNAPNAGPHHRLKLSLPMSEQAYDLVLTDRRGITREWRWRPPLIERDALDVVNVRDLPWLHHDSTEQVIAAVSGTLELDAGAFPVQVSQSGDETIWLSSFYRDVVTGSLEQSRWEQALDTLGREELLQLLFSDTAPASVPRADEQAQLRAEIWADWQPLRQWLRSYQQVWKRSLGPQPPSGVWTPPVEMAQLITELEYSNPLLLRQLLRGMAINDSDPLRRDRALAWLGAYYSSIDDVANQSAFHAWRFVHSPQENLRPLADWLLARGLSDMSLRLYRLDEAPQVTLASVQASLDAGWRLSPEALSPLPALWQAIWKQDWAGAGQLAGSLPADAPWHQFMERMPEEDAGVAWLRWAQQTPETDTNAAIYTGTRISPEGKVRSLLFYNPNRELHLQRALARPDSPVGFQITGPVRVKLTLNMYHEDPQAIIDDWIELAANGESKWLPILASRSNALIRQETAGSTGAMGLQQQVTITLGPGKQQLLVRPAQHGLLVKAEILSPLPMSGLVADMQQGRAELPINALAARDVLTNLDVRVLEPCAKADIAEEEPETQMTRADMDSGTDSDAVDKHWQAPHTLSDLSSPVVPMEATPTAVERYLLQLLWHWPGTGEAERIRRIAEANALVAAQPGRPQLTRLLRKLNEGYHWTLEDQVTASAGSRRVVAQTSSETPAVIAREKIVLPGLNHAWKRLKGHKQIGFFTRFVEATEVRLTLQQGVLPYHQAPPALIEVSLGSEPVSQISLPPLQQAETVTVPAGPQQLRVRLVQPSSDHWLYVKAEALLDGEWVSLADQERRRYDVATLAQPVEIYLDEPLWLRIDEYHPDGITRRYQLQREAGLLQLLPPPGEERAYYRIFGWRPKVGEGAVVPFEFAYPPVLIENLPGVAPLYSQARQSGLPLYRWSPDERLSDTARATDSAYLEFQSRRDFESDTDDDDDERFFEAGWRHRRALDCAGCYWRSDVFARDHNDDDIRVFGTRQWLRRNLDISGWRWEAQQSLLLQTDPETDWSWKGSAAVIQRHDINETLKHETSLQLFGRYLSADDPDNPVDNDIYSTYQSDHRYGARLQAGLRGAPWLDSRWVAHTRLSSNEDFNLFDPDYAQIGADWRQYWRPLVLSAGYRHRYYLQDDDRSSNQHRPLLRLALASRHGVGGGRLLHVDTRLDYDVDRDEFSFQLGFNWDFTRGRSLRDFDPFRTTFHSLYSRDLGNTMPSHRMTLSPNRSEHDAGRITDD